MITLLFAIILFILPLVALFTFFGIPLWIGTPPLLLIIICILHVYQKRDGKTDEV